MAYEVVYTEQVMAVYKHSMPDYNLPLLGRDAHHWLSVDFDIHATDQIATYRITGTIEVKDNIPFFFSPL